MKKSLINLLIGGGLGAAGLTLYNRLSPNKNIDSIEQDVINNYINEHKLKSSHKFTLMKAYMMYNKSFLDYGLLDKLNGFSFYQIYFNKDQADTENITQIYCIFCPKEQVCGHPSIQHGGVSATILDQNTGLLAMLNSYGMVATSELSLKYLRPVRKGEVYLMKGWIDHKQGRKIFVKATIQDIQTKKKVLEGDALMMTVNWEHKMADVFKFLFHKKSESI